MGKKQLSFCSSQAVSFSCSPLAKALLEKRCLACAQPFQPSAAHKDFCPTCSKELLPPSLSFCPVCGEIYPGQPNNQQLLCPACQNQKPPWEKIYFHAPFDGLLRQMILGLKFAGQLHLARGLATLLTSDNGLAPFQGHNTAYDLIVPVPLHNSRLFERSFNQAGEIARHLSKISGIGYSNAIKRIFPTRHQIGLSRRERVQNMRAAFALNEKVQDKNILLLDDVMTTGATLASAARCLLNGGARQVDVAVPARTRAHNMLRESRGL